MPPAKKTPAKTGVLQAHRRDVRKHILEAVNQRPGEFFSIGEISRALTEQYNTGTRPSSRAITLNLFDGDEPRSNIEGVAAVIVDGVKGAHRIVKTPRKVAKRTAAKAVDFTSPQDAERRAHQGIIDRLASKAPTAETPPVPGVLRKRPGRQTLTLNKGTKTHEGILDRLKGVVYCNVMLEPSRQRQYAGDGTIEGCDEFIAWLNKKNGPYFDTKRFEIIEVVGANRDQRENSGINKLYSEWLDGAEEYRIASALRLMNEMYSIGFHRGGETGAWRFYHGTGSGDLHIKFLMEKAKISVRKAHEVFVEYLIENLGPEMTSKLDLVGEDWIKKVEEQEAKAEHSGPNSEQAKYVEQA